MHQSTSNFINNHTSYGAYLKHIPASFPAPSLHTRGTTSSNSTSLPMVVTILPVVELTTQTHTANLRIDKLIQAVVAMQAKIEKENTVFDTIKRLRCLADEVYDEMLSAKYKRLNFTKFDGSGNH